MNEIADVETHAGTEVHHAHRDDEGAKLGMWIFLFTELMLFGGLFLLYMGYRYMHQEEFVMAASELDVAIGTLNTIILLTSSLTMALSIAALQKGSKTLSLVFLGSTLTLALLFLVNKFFEWSAKFAHGIYPGSPELANKGNGEILFFGLYYVMTGLHGIHVIIGMIIMSFMVVFILRGSVNSGNYVKLENSGLYWHLVDLIWIFLFPLFYLLH
ncbi:MAG TPA: cytochrome c oxidase subunit 3 family protein [Ignavibacteriales bacterium]|jgi:cytochrome c oxidase subunit 3|nr:cytochrome c oxidase subunit 3 family protein [Ignavibacteriales bacterium]